MSKRKFDEAFSNKNTTKMQVVNDQYYTSPHIIDECVETINNYVPPDALYIDTSAGHNYVAQKLNRPYASFDIDPPANHWGEIYQQDWLTVKRVYEVEARDPYTDILIGFNPPYSDSLCSKFLKHAFNGFHPKWFALVVPMSGIPKIVEDNYRIVEKKQLPENIFYKANEQRFSYPTYFLLLERLDWQVVDAIKKEKKQVKRNRIAALEKHLTRCDEKEADVLIRITGNAAGQEFIVKDRNRYLFHRANGVEENKSLSGFGDKRTDGIKPLVFKREIWYMAKFVNPKNVDTRKLVAYLYGKRPFGDSKGYLPHAEVEKVLLGFFNQ